MVLAGHYTPCTAGADLATTVETVTFDRPRRVAFRLLRGPVPYATEEFTLTEASGSTTLEYSGQLATDSGVAGARRARRGAAAWEAAFRASFAGIKAEAGRRARPQPGVRHRSFGKDL